MPNDPFADAMNTSGYAGLIGPNPYLEYTGKIRWRAISGAPTDAMGNPIASFTQAQQAARRLERGESGPSCAGAGHDAELDAPAWRRRPAARSVVTVPDGLTSIGNAV